MSAKFPLTFSVVFGAEEVVPSTPAVQRPSIKKFSREWTSFDPHLRIDEYSNETMHIAVATYLPTGLQANCGKYPFMVQNRAAAIAKLKREVTGT